MKSDYKKITQMINYLIRKDERAASIHELKIIKLVWAADRYHIRKYARTVSEDRYVAMKNGPVGSLTKDVAEFSDNEYSKVEPTDFEYIGSYIRFEKTNENGVLSSVNDVDYDELSETDKEALDFAWDTFGRYDWRTLVEITHKYPEWKKHQAALESGATKREDINLIDFFENIEDKNDPFRVTNEFLAGSKEMYLEYR
ncbi:SocA family protein [Candidatus Saccharibacteria bacterium]|nr:SocA family protein [Candidatus Saccharibacteria bacterium]